MVVNMHESKTNLSRLIKRALAGEKVIIAVNGEPKIRLVPLRTPTSPRVPGTARGQGSVTDSFFEPLPEDITREFSE